MSADGQSLADFLPRPRRRWPVALLAFVLGAGSMAGVAAVRDRSDSSDAVVKKAATTVVKAETRDLRTYLSYTGTLQVNGSVTVSAGSSGTVTEIVPVGTELTTGTVLARVDAVPITVIEGTVPVWRDLSATSAAGADIELLENYLVASGFDPSSKIAVDQTWTSATTAAVKRWQSALGVTVTGSISKAAVAVVPSGAVVTKTPTVGEVVRSGGSLADLQTLATPTVALAIPVSEMDKFTAGDTVDITLADATTTAKGKVATVGSVASAATGPNSSPSVSVSITADVDPATAIEGPVTVKLVDESALGAVTVPTRALVALAEGGLAIEVRNSDGTSKFVGVKTGMYVDGYVQITGKVAAGDQIVVPA